MTATTPNDDVEDVDERTTDALGNGIDPLTGQYALRPLSPKVLSTIAAGHPLSPEELNEVAEAVQRRKAHLGRGYQVDEGALDQAGWGIVFASNDSQVQDKKDRLKRLLERRRDEAGPLYKEFIGADGIQPAEAARKFLNRHGAAAGPVPVKKVPYYLLLAGSAADIPFDVQCGLDSRHAVGRLDLTLDELERYAERTIAREDSGKQAPRRAAFFATSNPADENTSRSARRLAKPLADTLTAKRGNWQVTQHLRADATKPRLKALLTGPEPPSLLFTASHGLSCAPDDPEQRERQGALVTQEWPGPATEARQMTADEYFAAGELPASSDLQGMIAFLFACFGAGTPRYDLFLRTPRAPLAELAAQPFVSRLSERMVQAGAQAVIGHVDRAWSCSFLWPGAGAQIGAFEDVMLMLADGRRVGEAVDVLHSRCNEISYELAEALTEQGNGMQNDEDVAGLWLAQTDAANYVIIGDPATRLLV
jgi:hypothetical protein